MSVFQDFYRRAERLRQRDRASRGRKPSALRARSHGTVKYNQTAKDDVLIGRSS